MYNAYSYPPTLPSNCQGRAAPGTTTGVELCIPKVTDGNGPMALANHPRQLQGARLASYPWTKLAGVRPVYGVPKLTDGTPSPPRQFTGARLRPDQLALASNCEFAFLLSILPRCLPLRNTRLRRCDSKLEFGHDLFEDTLIYLLFLYGICKTAAGALFIRGHKHGKQTITIENCPQKYRINQSHHRRHLSAQGVKLQTGSIKVRAAFTSFHNSPHHCGVFVFFLAHPAARVRLRRLRRALLISHNSPHTSHLTHNSSHTTHHTQLISHHSSHTTHLTQLISHTTHLTELISHISSHTSHLTHNSSHTQLISHKSSHTQLISHKSSHTQLISHTTPLTQFIFHSFPSCGRRNTQRLLKELGRGLSPAGPRLLSAWQAQYTELSEGAAARIVAGWAAALLCVAGAVLRTSNLLKELRRGLSPAGPRLSFARQAQYTEAPEGAGARIVAGWAAASLCVGGAVHRAPGTPA